MQAAPILNGFKAFAEGRFYLYLRKGFEEPLRDLLSPLETLWGRLERATPVASGRSSVAVWPLQGREERVVLRRYAHGGILGGILGCRFVGSGRPLRELALAELARESEVAVPLALGAVIERLTWPTCRAIFVSAEVPSSEDMVHFCRRVAQEPPEIAAREKRQALREAARQIRRLHDAGIEHADLHLKNLLVRCDKDDELRVVLIDLDGSRVRPPGWGDYRLRNLMRLARSVRKVRAADAVLTIRDRLRFLKEYLRGEPNAAGTLRAWSPRLAASGEWHEAWWRVTKAPRDLRGDRIQRDPKARVL